MLNFNAGFYERLFQSIDNNSVIMKVEKDGTYKPIWCTREYAEMMETEDIEQCLTLDKGSFETIHEEDREAVIYLFKNHITRDKKNNLTIRKYTFKGHLIWVNLHYAFVEDEDTVYAYCNYTNVTEIKESEAKTEAMYQSTLADLESLSSGALTFLRVNLSRDILEDLRGSDPFKFDPTPGIDHVAEWQRYLPLEADRQRFAEKISAPALIKTYQSGINNFAEYFLTQRLDGRKCFVKVTENIRQDPKTGDYVSFFAEYDYNNEMVIQTILNKALMEQYDMVTSLMDGEYSVVIGGLNYVKGKNIFPKNNTGHFEAYIQEQVIPVLQGDEDQIAAMKKALAYETIVQRLNKNDTYEADIVCNLDGEIHYKRFIFYVINRDAKFYLLLKADITAIIREQQERNEILANALQAAEQANAAKTSFLSNMSHEIRTPMNAIIGLDNIALSNPDISEVTRDQLTKIDASAKHLLSLINDILDMSRIESGKMTVKNEEFSFTNMLEQINTMIGGQCDSKGLKYIFKTQGDIDQYYYGDDMKLKQVLINILGNAVKFTNEGGSVTFIVEKTAQFKEQCNLRFTIEDTGIGMDKSFIPKIFDAFSQENENYNNKYGSTGLGMAITKNIVEMMNGHITVESEKGKGTTFVVSVTLKVSKKTEKDLDPTIDQEMKVLVIDDDPIDNAHAKMVLEHTDVTVDNALNREEAIKYIELRKGRMESYDLILVDWKMPKQNGIEIVNEIRK